MAKMNSSENQTIYFSQKNQLLLYSIFIAFGSISLYVFTVGLNTVYLGIVWGYGDSYIINASFLSLVSILASSIFFLSCWNMIKKRYFYKYYGLGATLILITYPLIILFRGDAMPISFEYFTILMIPALILMLVLLFTWKQPA